MLIYDSCEPAVRSCVETGTFAVARLYDNEKMMCLRARDYCEVCFSISGDRQFSAGSRGCECHYLSWTDQMSCVRVVIFVCPEYLARFSTERTDLNHCFTCSDSVRGHTLGMSQEERGQFMYFIHKLSQERGFGQDVLDQAVFLELMTFLNGIFISHCNQGETLARVESRAVPRPCHPQVDEILDYINQHLEETISIPALAAHFYISSSYLYRIFKDATGTTINQYITSRRISRAKILLADGHPVAETGSLCGFGDYSNFLKAFTKAVGLSPKKYASFARS